MTEKQEQKGHSDYVRPQLSQFQKQVEDFLLNELLGNPMISREEAEKKASLQAAEIYKDLFALDKYHGACKVLSFYLRTEIPKEELEKVELDLDKISDEINDGDIEKSLKAKTLQQHFDISNDTLMTFYNCGQSLFKDEKFDDAAGIFRFLTALNPLFGSFWLALGITEQRQGRFDEALCAYSIAIVADGDRDFLPYLHSVECYLERDDYANAMWSWSMCKGIMEQKSDAEVQPYEAVFKHLEDKLSAM